MDGHASLAAEAFREVERVKLLLEKKEESLSAAVQVMAMLSDDKSKLEYFNYTNQVLAEFEAKR